MGLDKSDVMDEFARADMRMKQLSVLAEAALSEHEHQFTIPVKWRMGLGDEGKYKEVTKLRCPCGEEIAR